MNITLNHTIVPSSNKIESAKFYERIFGFEFVKEWGPFSVVRVNSTFSLDFIETKEIHSIHYAFKVSDNEFDTILSRIKEEGIPVGSRPFSKDGKINHDFGGRGVYFSDPDGHDLEIITKDYDLDSPDPY